MLTCIKKVISEVLQGKATYGVDRCQGLLHLLLVSPALLKLSLMEILIALSGNQAKAMGTDSVGGEGTRSAEDITQWSFVTKLVEWK